MNIVDIVKDFEKVGFTREQSEMQVKTMADLKKDMFTKEDARLLENRILQKVEIIIDQKLESKFEKFELKLEKQLKEMFDNNLYKSAVITTGFTLSALGVLKLLSDLFDKIILK